MALPAFPPLPPRTVTLVTLVAEPLLPVVAVALELAPVFAVLLALPVAVESPVEPEPPDSPELAEPPLAADEPVGASFELLVLAAVPPLSPVPEDEPEPAPGLALALEDALPVEPELSLPACEEVLPEVPLPLPSSACRCWIAGDVGVSAVAATCPAVPSAGSSNGSAGRVPSADGEGDAVGTACSATLMVTSDRNPVGSSSLAKGDAEVVRVAAAGAADCASSRRCHGSRCRGSLRRRESHRLPRRERCRRWPPRCSTSFGPELPVNDRRRRSSSRSRSGEGL